MTKPYIAPRRQNGDQNCVSHGANQRIAFRLVFASLSFFVGVILGSLTWAYSVPIGGEVEPWDSLGFYYYGALTTSGFVAAILYPRSWWLGALGVYVGQIVFIELWYLPTLPAADPRIMPSFIAVAIFGMLPVVLGSLVAYIGCKQFSVRR